MSEFNAVVLKADGEVEFLSLNDDESRNADTIRETVEGWLEAVNMAHPVTGDVAVMWLDEEGKWKGSPKPNASANALGTFARVGLMPGDHIVGNVVLTGLRHKSPEDGTVTGPLPDAWVQSLTRLGLYPEG